MARKYSAPRLRSRCMCGRTSTRTQYKDGNRRCQIEDKRNRYPLFSILDPLPKQKLCRSPEMKIVNKKLNEAASDIDLAYCRAALYSALMLGFQPPTDETLSPLLP